MATQNATVPRMVRQITAIAAAEAIPARGTAYNPLRGDFRTTDPLKKRIAGFEDMARMKFSMQEVTLGGTVTACEVTIYQYPSTELAANPIGKLVLTNGVFVPDAQARGQAASVGAFTAAVTLITGTTPALTGKVMIVGMNEDGIAAP